VRDDVTIEKVSILIVDDEPSVGDALKLVLESNGYDVVLVAKGSEAIEQARNRRFAFGIVDLYLPDICGFQVITNIHDHQPEVPLLLVSGHGTPHLFAKATKLGAIGGLAKPFSPDEILTLITTALGR
jgi:DNA-binding NtrC family response regulator